MAPLPPLLPVVTLRRVQRVALFHGWSILTVTGFFALLSVALWDIKSAFICLAICAAGVGEVRGANLLKAGQARGIDWLIRSPLCLLTVILLYVGWQVATFDSAQVKQLIDPALNSPDLKMQLEEFGLTQDAVVQWSKTTYLVAYGVVALISLLYLGCLSLYYRSHRRTVMAAL